MKCLLMRNVELSDIPYLYEICLKTGASGKVASGLFYDPYLLGQYYAAPYAFFERELCFVCEIDGVPQGYILCASDTIRFNKWMENVWLPPLRRRYPLYYPQEKLKSDTEKQIVSFLHRTLDPSDSAESSFYERYPAHLHIDLLPSLQGMGQGRALVEKLFAALEAKNARGEGTGVPGIHLGVSGANAGAIGFYRKIGFQTLSEEDWGLVMGKVISN